MEQPEPQVGRVLVIGVWFEADPTHAGFRARVFDSEDQTRGTVATSPEQLLGMVNEWLSRCLANGS